jgi:hypothetical protein
MQSVVVYFASEVMQRLGMNVQVRPPVAAEQDWLLQPLTDAAAATVPRPDIEQPEARGHLVWPQAVGLLLVLNILGWAPILGVAWLVLG